MVTLIIPTYRNPEYLDICLKSAIEGQTQQNEIIVAVDGFIEESQAVLDKYKDKIKVLDLGQNQGMQTALNLAVFNANNERILIVNDDNVLDEGWDKTIEVELTENTVLTLNQIEPTGPGIFNFVVKDFGRTPSEFNYGDYIAYTREIKSDHKEFNGGIFPFAMWKKDYMIVGGFDTMYQSPFICDWDFFLKLELAGKRFYRSFRNHFYHFGSTATKNGKEGDKFKATEGPAAQLFFYKWGIAPQIFKNPANHYSHNPKNDNIIKGIKYD